MKKFVLALLWLLGGLTPALAVSEGAIPHEPIPAPYWRSDAVAPSGYVNALALDAADRPHLVYHDAATGMLRYALRQPGAWFLSAITYAPYVPADLSFDLALTPDGVPCVAYSGAPSDPLLYYGCLEGTTWQMEMIAAGGRFVTLTIDRDGLPHIALVRNLGDVVYVTQHASGAWQSTEVDQVPIYVSQTWLLVDSQRRPHLIYRGEETTLHAILQPGAGWEKEPVPFKVPVKPALGPDDALWLLISEGRAESGHPPFFFAQLFLARPDGDGWTTELLREDYDWQIEADLAVDQSNRAHVVYRDITGLLHYGRRALDGTWEPHSPGLSEQSEITMKLGGDGQPRLALQVNGQLMLLTRVVILDKHLFLPGVLRQP